MPLQPAGKINVLEREARSTIKTLFKKEGIEFNDAEVPSLSSTLPRKRPFPIIIIMMTLAKDGADLFTVFTDGAVVTGIGAVLMFLGRTFATAISLIVALVLFLWLLGKLNFFMKLGIRGLRAAFAKYALKRWGGSMFVELILPVLPLATIFALLAHHRENKYIALFLSAAEQYGKALKGGKVS